jgi:8-hydroxy-5-deazaflavin:NADPH oxidoreductase
MRVGIVGAGHIGGTAARLFARAGHEVAISNSRGPASLAGMVEALNHEVGTERVRAAAPADAAAFGDVVLLAVPWRAREAWPQPDWVRGKIVIDAMNPYGPGGKVVDLGESTSSEEVAKHLSGARVVKALNTIYWEHLAQQSRPDRPLDERRAIFVAGDDADAKRVVSRLVEELGFAPVDTGMLRDGGRRQQPGTPIYNRDLTRREAVAALAQPSSDAKGAPKGP